MGLKDALYVLENAGLKVRVDGRGTVIDQSLKPGAKINKGDVIVLEMSIS
jgi:cell division protein FtsI (penicillin-binding protein 3)